MNVSDSPAFSPTVLSPSPSAPSPSPNTTSTAPTPPWTGYQFIAWDLCLVEIMGITLYAIVMARGEKMRTIEDIVTARRSVPKWKVLAALHSARMGAWVVAAPPFYAANAGLLGLFMYSFSAGVSVLIIAYLAPVVERRRLHPLSFCEFIGWRYGAVPQVGITLLAIFTMSMSMLVELQTMGYLFRWYVPSIAWPINLAIGGQTLVYSCMAGLAVSIAVGQAQAGMGLFLVSVLAVYLLFTFNVSLPALTRPVIGSTELGFSALLAMPASLVPTAVFNEAMWQRAFAAEDPNELRRGAVWGAMAIAAVVFFCGLCGLLQVWGNPTVLATTDPYLFMLQGLVGAVDPNYGTLASWIGYIVVAFACVMAFGAVDSLQTGLLAAFASLYHQVIQSGQPASHTKAGVDFSPFWPRVAVICANVAILALSIFASYDQWPLLDLLLLPSMLGCAALLPSLKGLSPRLYPYFGGGSFMLSWLAGILCPSLYGISQNCSLSVDPDTQLWLCNPGGGPGSGLVFAWFRQFYRWQYFLLALGGSFGAMFCCAVVHVWTGSRLRPLRGFHPEFALPNPGGNSALDPFPLRTARCSASV